MPSSSLLIVEDESVIAWDLAEFFERRGYAISGIADDVDTAICLAENGKPDLALVDVRLARGQSGLKLARVLRDRLFIPSILVTANLEDAHAVREGAFGFVQKPFRHEQLAQVVDASLEWVREGKVDHPPEALIPTRKPTPAGSRESRMLVVEDSPQFSEFVQSCLSNAGYAVSATLSGKDAVKLCERPGSFDAAIVDIFMPEQDGFETLRALRERDPELRVVAIASPDEAGPLDVLRYARVFGANATLEKPFPCTRLLEVVADLVPS